MAESHDSRSDQEDDDDDDDDSKHTRMVVRETKNNEAEPQQAMATTVVTTTTTTTSILKHTSTSTTTPTPSPTAEQRLHWYLLGHGSGPRRHGRPGRPRRRRRRVRFQDKLQQYEDDDLNRTNNYNVLSDMERHRLWYSDGELHAMMRLYRYNPSLVYLLEELSIDPSPDNDNDNDNHPLDPDDKTTRKPKESSTRTFVPSPQSQPHKPLNNNNNNNNNIDPVEDHKKEHDATTTKDEQEETCNAVTFTDSPTQDVLLYLDVD